MSDAREQMAVRVEELTARYDSASLSFETTDELAALDAVFGQERAIRAIEFALSMDPPGYHLYAAGPDGLGKRTTVERFLRWRALLMPAPPDWVYVHNFEAPDRPIAMQLPAGEGRTFAEATAGAVGRALKEIRRAFESDSYVDERLAIDRGLADQRGERIQQLVDAAHALGFQTTVTPQAIVSEPLVDGRPVPDEQFRLLPTAQRQQIQQRRRDLDHLVQQTALELRRLELRALEAAEQLDERIAASAIEDLFLPLAERYAGQTGVISFLDALRVDLVKERDQHRAQPPGSAVSSTRPQLPLHRRYEVNVLVQHDRDGSAPVIFERHPNYYNLLGGIEHVGQSGTLLTDHMLIRAGSLARASGGYLVLRLRDLLLDPRAYDGLKRALAAEELVIQNALDSSGTVPMSGLRPQAIPLHVKVAIVGDSALYGLLYRLDPEFRELFRVKADFDVDLARTDVNIQGLAAVIRQQSEQAGLQRFSRSAVARLVEHASRVVENQRRLSANMSVFIDLIRQSDFWARNDGADVVHARHVERALDEAEYRSSLMRDRVQQLIDDGALLIDVVDSRVGRLNALSVYDLGDMSFGRPTRITCVVAPGRGTIVNIERETNMAGRVHNKGFLIAQAFLAHRFGQHRAMALHASVTFEQLYGDIDGDSASSTEIYALLSALAGVGIDQGVAVTGSVNQHGEVQPIGGATTKIEGFYEVCRAKGLTGTQGVLVPRANVRNIVLRPEVAQAIHDRRFHVWAVESIEQGIEVLTGFPAGERQADGRYPEGTIYRKIEEKLDEFALALAELRETGGLEAAAVIVHGPEPPPAPPPGIPPQPPPQPPIIL